MGKQKEKTKAKAESESEAFSFATRTAGPARCFDWSGGDVPGKHQKKRLDEGFSGAVVTGMLLWIHCPPVRY
jgi:hypothetical protein